MITFRKVVLFVVFVYKINNKRNNVQFEIEWDETDTTVVPVEDEFNERNRKKRRNVMQSWLKNKQWGGDSLQPKDSVSIEFDDN